MKEEGRRYQKGVCEHCQFAYTFYLIHNGFNESAYAYSESDPYVAILSRWTVPEGIPVPNHGKITVTHEKFLKESPAGGHFTSEAVPRCPNCGKSIDAEAARQYIEGVPDRGPRGWQWQGNWKGIYCIVFEDYLINDNWGSNSTEQGAAPNP